MKKRTETVNVSLTKEEKEQLNIVAEEVGVSMSVYLRMLTVRHLKRTKVNEGQE